MDNANLCWQAVAEMPKTPRFTPTPPRPLEILAYPAVQLLDVAGPLQVFASANELAAREGQAPLYAPHVVAADGPIVTASAGLGLATAPLPSTRSAVDTLLIAGGPGVHAAASDAMLLDWVRARAKRARRVASVCTGASSAGGGAGLAGGWALAPAERPETTPISRTASLSIS